VYETLLFLHVLAAFALMAGIVMFTGTAFGVELGPRQLFVANRLTDVGATVVLVFGVWIVLREDVYDITDGWILGAIVLWVIAVGLGAMTGRAMAESHGSRPEGRAAVLHWATTAVTVAILVLMIWKPGV
jgi:uncharacterized membrane protein